MRFRNISGEALNVGRPAPDGRRVEPDEVIEVPGELVEEIGDAYIVDTPDGQRAWPTATWSHVGDKPAPRKRERD